MKKDKNIPKPLPKRPKPKTIKDILGEEEEAQLCIDKIKRYLRTGEQQLLSKHIIDNELEMFILMLEAYEDKDIIKYVEEMIKSDRYIHVPQGMQRWIIILSDLLESSGCLVNPKILRNILNRINDKILKEVEEIKGHTTISFADVIYLTYKDFLEEKYPGEIILEEEKSPRVSRESPRNPIFPRSPYASRPGTPFESPRVSTDESKEAEEAKEALTNEEKFAIFEDLNSKTLDQLLTIYMGLKSEFDTGTELSAQDLYALTEILPNLLREKQKPITLSPPNRYPTLSEDEKYAIEVEHAGMPGNELLEELEGMINELEEGTDVLQQDKMYDIFKYIRDMAIDKGLKLPIYVRNY